MMARLLLDPLLFADPARQSRLWRLRVLHHAPTAHPTAWSGLPLGVAVGFGAALVVGLGMLALVTLGMP